MTIRDSIVITTVLRVLNARLALGLFSEGSYLSDEALASLKHLSICTAATTLGSFLFEAQIRMRACVLRPSFLDPDDSDFQSELRTHTPIV